MSALLLLAGAALAGSGPWTLPAGHQNVFVGGDYGAFRNIANGSGGSARLGSALRHVQLHGVYTVGLVEGFDVEVLLPYERAWATAPETGFCVEDRPGDWCDTTQGLGDASLMMRLRLLDEGSYRPITASVRIMARTGAGYASQRSRLTTLGDGQTDVGAGLAVGRTGASGGGRWYRVSAASSYWYRFGVGRLDGKKIPADEISFGLDVIGSPVRWFGLGGSIGGFTRLGGVALTEAEIGSPNAWVSLDAAQVMAGPELAFYTDNGWTFYGTARFTLASRSSPRDLTMGSVGIGRYIRRRARNEGPRADPGAQPEP